MRKTVLTRGRRRSTGGPSVSPCKVQVRDRSIAVLQSVADSEVDLPAADIARQLRSVIAGTSSTR